MLSPGGLPGSFTLLRPSRRGHPRRPEPEPGVNLDDPFDIGLSGLGCRLQRDGATSTPLDTRRWRADAGRSDRWLLDGCQGPTVDLGCGPGRLVAALTERGVPALGVDSSPRAIAQCSRRGAMVLHRDVFDTLPGEGRWHHVLLADGNLGIGGDPVALLRRVRRLISPEGSVLVELCSGEPGLWAGSARITGPDGLGGRPFPWAMVGVGAIADVAAAAGLGLRRLRQLPRRRRTFAELHPV
ncbi:MAG: class I SAM-dependent methyltransferase [Actinomycetota bacterium]|nr:class I SAM-dependent methyltransferase [Actinomycetota bacterium]